MKKTFILFFLILFGDLVFADCPNTWLANTSYICALNAGQTKNATYVPLQSGDVYFNGYGTQSIGGGEAHYTSQIRLGGTVLCNGTHASSCIATVSSGTSYTVKATASHTGNYYFVLEQFGGGGGDTGDRPNGQSCSSNDQCESGWCQGSFAKICCPMGKTCCEYDEDCTSNVCNTWDHYCEDAAKKPYGASCSSNNDCESGNCNHVCCEAGKTCCEYNSDCPSGQSCNTSYHYCVVSAGGTKSYCQSCSSDSECSSNYCGDFGTGGKKCANPDVSTYCCPDGTYIPNFQYGVDCCDMCTDAQGGIYTMDCINHKCVEESHGSTGNCHECSTDDECQTGYCIQFGDGKRRCATLNAAMCCADYTLIDNYQSGVDCCIDVDCGAGKVCSNRKCVVGSAGKSNGQSCTSNSECGSGNCNWVCCQVGKKCCNYDFDCTTIGDDSTSNLVCNKSEYFCVNKAEKYTESAPFWLSVSGLNAIDCEDDVSLGIVKIKEGKAAAWVKALGTYGDVLLIKAGETTTYPAYEADVSIKVSASNFTEDIAVLDEVIHTWKYPSIKEGQATNVKCQRYTEEYGGDAQNQADEIIAKGFNALECGDGTCNIDKGENCYSCPKDCGCTSASSCCIADSSIMHSDSPTGCANSGDMVWEYEGEKIFCCEGKIGGQGTDTCCVNSDCKAGQECVNETVYGTEIKICTESSTKSCTTYSDCALGEYCSNYKCIPDPDYKVCGEQLYSPKVQKCCNNSVLVNNEMSCGLGEVDLKDPSKVLGYNLGGMSEEGAAQYDGDNSLSNVFGMSLDGYAMPAKNWREVANYEFRKGKRALGNSRNLGIFNWLNWGMKGAYKLASFLDSLSQLPDQMQKLSELKNVKELTESAENIALLIGFTDNMVSVTGTIYEAIPTSKEMKVAEEDKSVFKAIASNGLWTLTTVASGGWTLLADASNAMSGDNVNSSIAYETEVGDLSMFMSIHADIAQKMAEKLNPTSNDLKQYFYSVKTFIKMKRMEDALKYRDAVAVWNTDNKAFFTKALYFIAGASDSEKIISEEKAKLAEANKQYAEMEKSVDEIMKGMGVVLQ